MLNLEIFSSDMLKMFLVGTGESLYMTLVASLIAYIIGLPLGLILVVTSKDGIKPNRYINGILGVIINVLRSLPFIILLVAVRPITSFIVGQTIGSTALIVPLVIASAPYIARLVESSIKEIDHGVVEAAKSMGASTMQIVTKVLLPEAKPSLIVGGAIAITTILGYSAMGGIVGAGGLGKIGIDYGYYRTETEVVIITMLLLILIVQLIQELGMKIVKVSDKRNR